MNLIYKELRKLVDDYYRCDSLEIKELILNDIMLLSEALHEYNQLNENVIV